MGLLKTNIKLRTFAVFGLALMLFTLVSTGLSPKQAHASDAVVNVPAAVLFVNCPTAVSETISVDFYYVRLDGSLATRIATAANGGLTYNTNGPTVQFYELSIDYLNTDALYVFNYADGSYSEVYVPVGGWGRDASNGNIFTSAKC